MLCVALELFALGVLDRAEQTLDLSFDEGKSEYDALEYGKEELGYASLSACEEIGNIYSKDSGGDYDKTRLSEYFDDTVADDTADKSAAYRALSVLEELDGVKRDILVPIGYGM